jgi:hypothetical protein
VVLCGTAVILLLDLDSFGFVPACPHLDKVRAESRSIERSCIQDLLQIGQGDGGRRLWATRNVVQTAIVGALGRMRKVSLMGSRRSSVFR